jgi:guanylate cyclase
MSVPGLVAAIQNLGEDQADDEDLALQKRVLVGVASLVAFAGVLWAAVYIAFGEVFAGSIPISYSILSGISIVIFAITRRYLLFRATQLLLILILPFALQLSLGGFVPASAVVLWAFLAPLGGMLMVNRRIGAMLFGVFIVLVVLAQILQPDLTVENNLPDWLVGLFFVMNVGAVSAVVFLTVFYFEGQRDQARVLLIEEQARSERLLLNVLPREIAAQLKEHDRTDAKHFDSASVLFADIVGFTSLTANLEPDQLIGKLNDVFLFFDDLVERYGCEKIRTIGDNYMVAAGVPTPRPDHAHALAAMALDMVEYSTKSSDLSFRLGMDSGPLVAGVIGRSKFQYDLWGDVVNAASRMESHGVPGRVQITANSYDLIKNEFTCESRGPIEIKGKGEMNTWFIVGRDHS